MSPRHLLAAAAAVLPLAGCHCAQALAPDAGTVPHDAAGADSTVDAAPPADGSTDASDASDAGTQDPLPIPSAVELTLGAAGLVPGGAPALHVEVRGEVPELEVLELVVTVQEPGSALAVDPRHGELRPGSRPPTGAVHWLRADGTWSDTEAVFGAAMTTDIAPALPSASEGLWRLTVRLRETASRTPIAASTANLLVSARPAMALSVSRLIANLQDPVRVELLTAAGAGEDVRIAAWLEAPDGAQLALPHRTATMQLAHDGAATSARRTLWQGSLGALSGRGTYRVQARMYDAASGDLVATGDAALVVCDDLGHLSGVVRDAGGMPITPAAGEASVRALDTAEDRASSALAEVAPDGSFTLDVLPGTYVLVAERNAEAVARPSVVVVGCGEAASVELGASVAVIPAAPLPPLPRRIGGGADLVDGLPRPTVAFNGSGRTGEQLATWLHTLIGRRVARENPDVTVTTRIDSTGALEAAAELMEQYPYDSSRIPEIEALIDRVQAGAGGSEFAGHIVTRPLPDRSNVLEGGYLSISADAERLYGHTELLPAGMDPWMQGDPVLGPHMSEPDGRPLYELFRPRRAAPRRPTVEVILPGPDAPVGSTVTARVRVTEEGTGEPAPAGLTIRLGRHVQDCNPFARPECSAETTHTTDANGEVAVSFEVLGTTELDAFFVRADRQGFAASGFLTGFVPSGDVEVRADRAAVRHGQSANVTVTALRASGPVSGRSLSLASSLGVLSRTSATTATDGTAGATYTGGERSGLGRIEATGSTPPPGGAGGGDTPEAGVGHVVVDGLVDFTVHATPPTVFTRASGLVSMDVRVGGVALSNLRIDLRLEGAGALESTSVETDATGHAEVRWAAPSSGTGTSSVDATLHVDGHQYLQTVTFAYEPGCTPAACGGACGLTDDGCGGNVIGCGDTFAGVLTFASVPGECCAGATCMGVPSFGNVTVTAADGPGADNDVVSWIDAMTGAPQSCTGTLCGGTGTGRISCGTFYVLTWLPTSVTFAWSPIPGYSCTATGSR